MKWVDIDIYKIAELSFYIEACLAKKDIFVSSKTIDEFAEKVLKENNL